MKSSKSLSGLNQKYRGKPKKYAEGGRVRRPAAAPVASPFDADYIERLAAQAVGAGEPVTEVRSSEGRGFAPMPRSFGEAGQRMSAVIRGDVEPTPEEERQINFVRGFTEGPAVISPTIARSIQMATRIPKDKRFVRAVEATPGARISDEGISLELLRYQKPEQAGAESVREGVFYLPATLPSRNVGTYRGSNQAGYGGSEMVRGETLLRAPLAVPGNTGGTVPERAYRELTSAADLKKLQSDVRNVSTSRFLGPDYRLLVEDFLSRHEGNPSLANEIIRNSNVGNRMRYALQENAIGARARKEGYDSIVGTGARTPRITEVFDLREGAYPVPGSPEFETLVPYFERLIPGYAEGGLAALDEKYAEGGTVRAPKETTIAGQDHRLAYITDREAALLKARGGSGRMTDYGVRAYDEGTGGDPSDNANSNSEAATQDAAGGNAGQGAGPTGAGAGATGEPGPGPTGAAPTGEGQSEVNTPGQAPGISTEPTTNINIGLEDQANAAAALGALANAPIGFEAIGVRDALDMYDQGRISFAEMVGYGLNNMLGPPGTQIGVNVNPRDQTQTPAYDISIPGLAMGALGMISGIPGLGMLGGRAGTALGNALGIPSVTVEYSPGQFDAPTTATSVGEYSQYGQPGYGTPGMSNIATPMARGGMASLEKMHAKYAEGGDVRASAGEVAEYNPEEIDRIARQIHLRFPEEDLIRPSYEDVESPSDLTMRARLMMRGQNVGLPETVRMGGGNDRFTSSTSMQNIPIESEPYETSQRMLNTNINAVLDAERNARIGAGMLALERSGERGFTGYGPQLSAGYGPASIYGGYQAITPNMPGAKSQGSYVYGGSLNIPIDESGTEANIGGTVMSGRRGQSGGPSGTQIMGSLERPLLGGRLALELAADPSLRHKEILLGYRRAF